MKRWKLWLRILSCYPATMRTFDPFKLCEASKSFPFRFVLHLGIATGANSLQGIAVFSLFFLPAAICHKYVYTYLYISSVGNI